MMAYTEVKTEPSIYGCHAPNQPSQMFDTVEDCCLIRFSRLCTTTPQALDFLYTNFPHRERHEWDLRMQQLGGYNIGMARAYEDWSISDYHHVFAQRHPHIYHTKLMPMQQHSPKRVTPPPSPLNYMHAQLQQPSVASQMQHQPLHHTPVMPVVAHLPSKQHLRRFACNQCTRTFYRKEHLQRHILSHTKEKPHRCDECSSAFSRKDLLQRHKRSLHQYHS